MHFICIELRLRPETQWVKQTKVPVTETDGGGQRSELRRASSQKAKFRSICIKRRQTGQRIPAGTETESECVGTRRTTPFGPQRLPPPTESHVHWMKRQKMIVLLFNFDVKNVHRGAKNVQGGKDSLFSKWGLENHVATWRRSKPDDDVPPPHTHTHTNTSGRLKP